MNRDKFLDLVWRLNEILMQSDYLRNQVGKCGGECDGYDGDDEGLCSSCCTAFAKGIAEDERLSGNKELEEVLAKLKKACDEDKTGEYERILNQSREGKVIH